MVTLPAHTLIGLWPFASSWMLLWVAAAAAPVLIHLWNRRRYTEVDWAAMSFLLAAVRNNARRIRIEQLILLLIRSAILVLLGLAVAEPVISVFPALGGQPAPGQTHWILVIDGSYSMDYRNATGARRFDRAKEIALKWVRQSRQGDGFTLLKMGDAPQLIIADPAFDPNDVARELQELRIGHGGADLTACLAEVEQIVTRVESRYTRLRRTQICLLSDLDAATWQSAAEPANRDAIARLADRATLALIDVGQSVEQNLAVVGTRIRQPVLTVTRQATLEASVRNFGQQPVSRRVLEFLLDGQRIREFSLSLKPGEQTTVNMTHRFETTGDHLFEARLAEDRLRIDNQRWHVALVRGAVRRVLCVEGKPGAAKLLQLAMRPDPSAATAAIDPLIQPETALLERDLTPFSVICLCNVGRVSPEEAGVLNRYVQQGGALFIFPGDLVQPSSYNTSLSGTENSSVQLLPAELIGTSEVASFRFAPKDYEHPIVAPFQGQGELGLLSTPIYRYMRLKAKEDAAVVLPLDSGDPAIVERPSGAGIVMLFAIPASRRSLASAEGTPWSDLPVLPSFLPLVHESLHYALEHSGEIRNVLVGQPLRGEVPPSTTPQVRLPDGSSQRVAINSNGRRWEFLGTQLSGGYEVRPDSPDAQSQWFAVNVDTKESRLDRVDPADIPSQFESGLQEMNGSSEVDAPITATDRSLFRHLLGAVFVLLVVESFLASSIGRH